MAYRVGPMSTRSMRFLLITNLKNTKNCLGDGWEIILHSVRMTVVYVCGGYMCVLKLESHYVIPVCLKFKTLLAQLPE